MAEQCENLGKTKRGEKPSVLKDKTCNALKTFSWFKILEEGQEKCPDILDFIVAICAPSHREQLNKSKKGETRVPAIGLAYALMVHQANQQLSLVQRMNTLILCHGHADKMVCLFYSAFLPHWEELSFVSYFGMCYRIGYGFAGSPFLKLGIFFTPFLVW